MKLKSKRTHILFRAIRPYLATIIVSAFTATITTLIFYPLQKTTDYKFWRRQYEVMYKEKILDKRIELIDEFTTTAGKFDYCAVQASVFIEKNLLTKEVSDCFADSFIELGALLVQIDIYYFGIIKEQTDNFGNFINSYQTIAKAGGETSELSKELQIERDKLLQVMITNIKANIGN